MFWQLCQWCTVLCCVFPFPFLWGHTSLVCPGFLQIQQIIPISYFKINIKIDVLYSIQLYFHISYAV